MSELRTITADQEYALIAAAFQSLLAEQVRLGNYVDVAYQLGDAARHIDQWITNNSIDRVASL